MLKYVCLALFLASASATPAVRGPSIHPLAARGIVSPVERCGGDATPLQLRVTDCTTPPCIIQPGQEYKIEGDFIASVSNNGVSLKLEAHIGSNVITIIDLPAEGGMIGGATYTVSYDVTVTSALAGQDVILQITVYETANGRVEICIRAPATILPL